MMRHCKRVRVVGLVRAARVAATGLLVTVAVAAVASQALASQALASTAQASTAHPGLSMTGLGSVRHVILQAAMVGTAIMLLLTIGLLFLGRMSKAAVRPKPQLVPQPQLVPPAEPSLDSRPSGTSSPSWLAETFELDESSVPPDVSAGDSRLDPVDPPADVDLASHVSQPTAVDPASPSDDEPSWPDFLALASDDDKANEPSYPPEPPQVAELSEPSPLRPGDDDVVRHRHQVALGDDQIAVELAAARPAATPYVRWAPLPYDVPEDGLAFACIGAGDEGCLFVDLAAAPGTVAISGDTDAAVRLAESIVYQLCAGAAAEQSISVLLVGSCIPRPHPASAIPVETLRDLAAAGLDSPADNTDIVFCELRSDEDASALARHVSSSRHRIVPVVLGHVSDAAWSFTACTNPLLDGEQVSELRAASART